MERSIEAECGNCGGPNPLPNFRACPVCRAIWRKWSANSRAKGEPKTVRLSKAEYELLMAEADKARKLAVFLRRYREIALEVYKLHDADQDAKVLKLLGAMAGTRGYRADLDAIHAALDSMGTASHAK